MNFDLYLYDLRLVSRHWHGRRCLSISHKQVSAAWAGYTDITCHCGQREA